MKSKSGRVTSGILAVLAATVVACGSSQAASGRADPARDAGANYLSADGNYGVALAPEYLGLQLVP